MKRTLEYINCKDFDYKTKMQNKYCVVKYTFNYTTNINDKRLIDEIIEKGAVMARNVNPGFANNGTNLRDYDRIINNCVAGILSEYLWKDYLNHEIQIVEETDFQSSLNQIDLQIISNKKKLEVRSSFPRNGIKFALCSSSFEFDIIGMYSNSYKSTEIQKDYYLRSLFHLDIERYWIKDQITKIPIIEKLIDKIKKDNFEGYLTGGATREMMLDNEISLEKNLIPDDEMNINKIKSKTSYRVTPFSKSLDSETIYNMIKFDK